MTKLLGGFPAGLPALVAVVQHLDPRHRSLMAEILGKRTSLEVKQAEEGDRVRHECTIQRTLQLDVDGEVQGVVLLMEEERV